MQAHHQAGSLVPTSSGEATTKAPLWQVAAAPAPQVITITSGKGGVGKTQLTASLAVAAALRGHRVAVIDADLGLASLDLAFGVQPQADLRAVVAGALTVDNIITQGPCGIDLVAACPGRYDMANLGTLERDKLLTALREFARGYDVVFIDTGAGIGCNAVSFAALGAVILVVTPDPTSLRDAYAMAKVLHRRCGVERIHMVANQVRYPQDGLEMYERVRGVIERFLALHLDYLGSVPRDSQVQASATSGVPFLLHSPDSPASSAMVEVAKQLLDNQLAAPAALTPRATL